MKVIRDPLHNLIGFNKEQERLILDLLDSVEMQRLRRIRQLGLSFVTYPGAEHSRFVHSLGVTHLVKRIIYQLNLSRNDQEQTWLGNINDNRELALCAALLHDIGHGPFSHAIEKTTGIEHEAWTTLIINSETTEVHAILESYRSGFANEVAEVIGRIHPCRAVVKLLSSQLDADRIDYLLRDSLMTGAGYGRFDLEWLINVMTIGLVGSEPEVGLLLDKGLSIAEDFVMARYYMYQNVYFHKATRSAEIIVAKILQRAQELIEVGSIDVPTELKGILSGNMTCNNDYLPFYLLLDDNTIWYLFSLWSKSNDPLLSDLCYRIINRRLFKSITIEATDITSILSKIQTLKSISRDRFGEDGDRFIEIDHPTTNSYKDNYLFASNQNPADTEASEEIFLFGKDKRAFDLARKSLIINAIRNQVLHIHRLYFPEELRSEVTRLFSERG